MRTLSILLPILLIFLSSSLGAQDQPTNRPSDLGPLEFLGDAHRPQTPNELQSTPVRKVARGAFTSVQVNVDSNGMDVLGDAANEPSIAVDPNDPQRIVIGWRQFDSILSDFREAGVSWSHDGGSSWTAGEIESGIFRSDPVLAADRQGNFYYYSLSLPGGNLQCETFRSTDGGQSWETPVFAFGGDKAWIEIDITGGPGDGNIYAAWSPFFGCCGSDIANRSTDAVQTFDTPVDIPGQPVFGVTAIGPDGELYVAGADATFNDIVVTRSTNADQDVLPMAFEQRATTSLGGSLGFSSGPNPGGLLGQVWIAVDTSPLPSLSRGNVYLLASVDPPGPDPLDVRFSRSTDGGQTWSTPITINDDGNTDAWQWFGTLAVAPNGRIDAIWNDTRNAAGFGGSGFGSELYYASSSDGGLTWSTDRPLSPLFDPHLGFPQQQKIGDYYDMISDDEGAPITYAATFAGEENVYYLRLQLDAEVFADGFESGDSAAWSSVVP